MRLLLHLPKIQISIKSIEGFQCLSGKPILLPPSSAFLSLLSSYCLFPFIINIYIDDVNLVKTLLFRAEVDGFAALTVKKNDVELEADALVGVSHILKEYQLGNCFRFAELVDGFNHRVNNLG